MGRSIKKHMMMIMICRKHLVGIFRGLQREKEQRRRSAEENFQQNAEISATLLLFKIIKHSILLVPPQMLERLSRRPTREKSGTQLKLAATRVSSSCLLRWRLLVAFTPEQWLK